MFTVFSGNQETFDHQGEVELERFTIDLSSHDFDHFLGEFEIGSFESEVIGRGDIEYETKIDVD